MLAKLHGMGWARTLLLGDVGNRLDIADAESQIERLKWDLKSASDTAREKNTEIARLKDDLGRQRLAVQALTRFLIKKGVVGEAELIDFIIEVDAEDGVVDGRMEIDSESGRLHFLDKSYSPFKAVDEP